MDQLKAMVSEKAGISEEQSSQAVDMVVSFLKERLPAPVASQIDSVVGGQGQSAKKGDGGLGSMLGG